MRVLLLLLLSSVASAATTYTGAPASVAGSSVTAFQGGTWTVGTTAPANQAVSLSSGGYTNPFYVVHEGTAPVSVIGTVPVSLSTGAVSVSGSTVSITQTVTVSVSNTPSVNASLAAETTKVIGTVNMAAGQTIAATNAGTFAVQAAISTGAMSVSGSTVIIAAQGGTLPVSLASVPSHAVTLATGAVSVSGSSVTAFISGSVPVSLSTGAVSVSGSTVSLTALPALAAGSAIIGTVWDNIISTFSQPNPGWVQISSGPNGQGVAVSSFGARSPTAYFLNVQEAKDAGRLLFVATGSFTGALAEGLVTMAPIRGGIGGASGTSFGVTAGKTLRLQSWCCTWRNNTAAAGGVTCFLRHSSGATALGSPSLSVLNASTALATVGSGATECAQFPEGIELTGAQTFGVSAAAVGAVVGSSVTVNGFEY